MLTILGQGGRYCDGLTRRTFLRVGGLALGGMSLPQMLRAEAASGKGSSHKAIIMILLPGGAPHQDMVDLKPDAPSEIRGEFKPIKTNVRGIEISELMPRLATVMDKLAIVRSLVGAKDDHNIHQCLTGWESHPQQDDSPLIPGFPVNGGWPSIGSVISKVHGATQPGLPPFVSLGSRNATSMTRASMGQPGYLGTPHAGFEPFGQSRADMVLEGVTLERLADRRRLLASIDRFRRDADHSGAMDGLDAFTQQAFGVLTSSTLAQAFDLEQEDPKLRARYGITGGKVPAKGGPKLLEQFLIARRLVEAGVRCVTLSFSRWPLERESRGGYNWDWHTDNFNKARATVPLLDQGLAALIEDLDGRGLLDDVTVVVWGEFGRTPRINASAGRDHWPRVSSCILAGGGMRTGQVIGATNRLAEYAKDRPVHFRDVFATLYHNVGIDANATALTDRSGRSHYLVDNREPLPELV
jgi:hypothetical protein